MMDVVVPECRRVLKPSGSAVFVLQPNSERVGRMRTWLWDFLAKWGREWGQVQDVWWWNYTAIPGIHATHHELMRGSIKACVWLGPPNCHRNQSSVLWRVSDYTVKQAMQSADRWKQTTASGHAMNRTAASEAAIANGGSTPYNLLPVSNARGHTSAGANGHGAGTPLALCDWWVRYICPAGGIALDPFAGLATVGMAAVAEGCRFVGIEQDDGYFHTAARRLESAVRDARDDLFPAVDHPAPADPRGLFDGGET